MKINIDYIFSPTNDSLQKQNNKLTGNATNASIVSCSHDTDGNKIDIKAN